MMEVDDVAPLSKPTSTATRIMSTPNTRWIAAVFLERAGTPFKSERPPSITASIGSEVPSAQARVM
jgi:hypothetical protein